MWTYITAGSGLLDWQKSFPEGKMRDCVEGEGWEEEELNVMWIFPFRKLSLSYTAKPKSCKIVRISQQCGKILSQAIIANSLAEVPSRQRSVRGEQDHVHVSRRIFSFTHAILSPVSRRLALTQPATNRLASGCSSFPSSSTSTRRLPLYLRVPSSGQHRAAQNFLKLPSPLPVSRSSPLLSFKTESSQYPPNGSCLPLQEIDPRPNLKHVLWLQGAAKLQLTHDLQDDLCKSAECNTEGHGLPQVAFFIPGFRSSPPRGFDDTFNSLDFATSAQDKFHFFF
ncbi:hypothetical protein C8F04DRAFT_1233233 [Mycena alexandri]|uniref:Uncharacterized protein n=1 Tax=Mycena alexandri TaxID=1745969 RepID=A0AAD6X4F1_9AGAR|nr:hypothetical protein C8F04DRAFT_1233233 [Mycena alexandri]